MPHPDRTPSMERISPPPGTTSGPAETDNGVTVLAYPICDDDTGAGSSATLGSSSPTRREDPSPSLTLDFDFRKRREERPDPVPSLLAVHDWSIKNGWGELLLWRGYVTQRRRGIWRDSDGGGGGGGRRLRRENRLRFFPEPDPEPNTELESLHHQSVVPLVSGPAPSLEPSIGCDGAPAKKDGDGDCVYVEFHPQGLRSTAAESQNEYRHQSIALPSSGSDPVDSLSPPLPSRRSPASAFPTPDPIPVTANRRPSLVSAFSFSSCSTVSSSSSLSVYSVEDESTTTALRPPPPSSPPPPRGADGERGGALSDEDKRSSRHCGVLEGPPSHGISDNDDVGFSYDDNPEVCARDADTWRYSYTSEEHRASILTACGVCVSSRAEKPGLVRVVGGRGSGVSRDGLC